jgi:hypothetical protein
MRFYERRGGVVKIWLILFINDYFFFDCNYLMEIADFYRVHVKPNL